MSQLEIKPTAAMRVRVLAIICIAVGFALYLAWLLTGQGGGLFAARTTISTLLPDATGIDVKSPVRLSGIQIGEVQAVKLSGRPDPQHAVLVEMTIKRLYLRDIPLDSTTAIGAETLIGDKYIDINEGKSAASLPDNGVLESEPVKQAADRADLMRALANDLRQIDGLVATMTDPNSRLGHFIVGELEYDQILNDVKQFDNSVRSLVSPQSPLGEMLFTHNLYDQIHSDAVRADHELQSIQAGEGAAGRFFASDQQYEDLVAHLKSLRSALAGLSAGNGKFGATLTDDEGWRKAARALAGIDAAISRLNAGEGRIGNLLRSPGLYESLNGSLRDLEEFLRDLQENPGKYLHYRVFGKKKPYAGRK